MRKVANLNNSDNWPESHYVGFRNNANFSFISLFYFIVDTEVSFVETYHRSESINNNSSGRVQRQSHYGSPGVWMHRAQSSGR